MKQILITKAINIYSTVEIHPKNSQNELHIKMKVQDKVYSFIQMNNNINNIEYFKRRKKYIKYT